MRLAILVGDFKDGAAACGAAGYLRQWQHFQRFVAGQRRVIGKLWRWQVFGEPRIHALRVTVQPGQAGRPPFAFTPVGNPLSSDPHAAPRHGR